MKAAYVTKPGPADSIIIGDLPTPEPTGDQVLDRRRAVGRGGVGRGILSDESQQEDS